MTNLSEHLENVEHREEEGGETSGGPRIVLEIEGVT